MMAKDYMQLALDEAKKAFERDEVPIGAIIVNSHSGEVVARASNRTRELNDPSAHAEILAIRQACEKMGAQRIPDHDLYVTLEPCTMCAGAISFARIKTLYFGAIDEKGGGVLNGAKFFSRATCHHKPELSDALLSDECAQILKDFFAGKR